MPQLYDYFFDDEKLEWIPWNQLVPAYIHDPERKFIDILVPTLDTVRATWLLNLQVGAHYFLGFPNISWIESGKKTINLIVSWCTENNVEDLHFMAAYQCLATSVHKPLHCKTTLCYTQSSCTFIKLHCRICYRKHIKTTHGSFCRSLCPRN